MVDLNIYSFGLGMQSKETSPEILGGKGAGLVWMDQNGIKVPPGFIIPTTACVDYHASSASKKLVMKSIKESIVPWMDKLTEKFGYRPLVSVRSGARVSMPGMMDTILNVGLDTETFNYWVNRIGDTAATNCMTRLVEMYSSVVLGIERKHFEGKSFDEVLSTYRDLAPADNFPSADTQLLNSIEAVFKSWRNDRAVYYRKINNIPEDWGTAVTVQAMVFGNMNDQSCSGVLFTRNPDTGANEITGEFLVNSQGEDVVAGIRTPTHLSKMSEWNSSISDELVDTVTKLEELKNDVQDVEFTVQNGELFILQTRNAKRSSRAAVRIAVEMFENEEITLDTLFSRVKYLDYIKAQIPSIPSSFKDKPNFVGIPACSGIATGVVVKTSKAAINCKVPCILVTQETNPDDIAGMHAARGVLTMTGGATSHAAVVARNLNKPCVVGLSVSLESFDEGETISLDGSTGRVWKTAVPISTGHDEYLSKFNYLLEKKVDSSSGIKIIDDKNGDLLDLSGYVNGAFLFATQAINFSLKTRPTVIVDVRPNDNYATKVYDSLFGTPVDKNAELKIVQAILKMFSPSQVKFITNLTPVEIGDTGVRIIPVINTLSDIVMANEDYVLSEFPSKDEDVAKRLVNLKKKAEGLSPLSIGQVIDGKGYVTKSQLAQLLLG